MGDVLAYAIVAIVVLWSAWVALRKILPNTMYRLQLAMSAYAGQQGFARLSRWLTPKATSSSCGGCSSCGDESPSGDCATPGATKSDEQKPVQWR